MDADESLWSKPQSSNKNVTNLKKLSYIVDESKPAVINDSSSEHIQKKKKIVSDLLALRKMKAAQNSSFRPDIGFSQSIKILSQSHVTPTQLQPFLERTMMKEELNELYGKEGIAKAAKHFSSLASNSQTSDSQEAGEVKRKQFLDMLVQKRRNKFDDNQRLRNDVQKTLIDKQLELNQDLLNPLDENLIDFVQETKEKLPLIEDAVRVLKIKYAKDLSLTSKGKANASVLFERFKLKHKDEVEIVQFSIDVILERVYQQCIVNANNSYDSDVMQTLLLSDKQQYNELQMQIIKSDALLSILVEIVEESLKSLLQNLCEECLYLACMTHVYTKDIILKSVDLSITKSKKPVNAVISESYFNIRSARDRLRGGLWNHTQATLQEERALLPTLPGKPSPSLPVSATNSGLDLSLVSSENVISKIESKLGNSPNMLAYSMKECSLWKAMTADTPNFTFCTSVTLGVSCACLTTNHTLFAIGTCRGDILVYDMTWQPSRLIRSVSYEAKTNDSIISIHWSLDYSRLVTLSNGGCVIVWSVSFAPYVSVNDLHSLDLRKLQYNSQQLTALCVLEASKGDFLFRAGDLQENAGESSFPSLVLFYPALSFTGSQDNIVVALRNGDIIKCNLTATIQQHCKSTLFPNLAAQGNDQQYQYVLGNCGGVETKKVNKIALDIEADLFRNHRSELLQICFQNNGGNMISLDSNMNIFHWRYDVKYLNSFGWFLPYKKYNLIFVEEFLIAKGEDQLIFEDIYASKKATKAKKRKSKQAVEVERRRVLKELQALDIANQTPWHSDEFLDELDETNKFKKLPKIITRVYAPSEDYLSESSAGGAVFSVVTIKRDGGLLVKYALRTYESQLSSAVSVLQSIVSSTGDRMYFMLLYDEQLPKIHKHITFIDLHLEDMQLGKLGSIQISLSSSEFSKCKDENAASFSLSRVDGCTGTEYIVSNICGKIHAHSLLSGREVVYAHPEKQSEMKELNGLVLPSSIKKLNPTSKILIVNPNGDAMYILVVPVPTSKTAAAVKAIRITDPSSHEDRLSVAQSYKNIFAFKHLYKKTTDDAVEVGMHKVEQNCFKETWTCRYMPLSLYMTLMLNTAIDVAVVRSTGVRLVQESRKKMWNRDWTNMQEYFT